MADLTLKLKGVEADLVLEKKEEKAEQEAAEQQIGVLNDRVATLEQDKINQKKTFEASETLFWKSINWPFRKRTEIRLADALRIQKRG